MQKWTNFNEIQVKNYWSICYREVVPTAKKIQQIISQQLELLISLFRKTDTVTFFIWIIKLIQIVSIHYFFASLSILLCWSNYVYMSCKWYCITNLSNDKWVSSKYIIESVLRFSCFKIRDPQEDPRVLSEVYLGPVSNIYDGGFWENN